MRIVLDLEAAQAPNSRNRGIGRFSIALAKAMLRQRGNHEMIVALNGMYESTVGPVREALEGLLPSTDIVTWSAAMPPQHAHTPGELRAFARVRQAFFESLHPDVVHVASLFPFGPHSFATIGDPPAHHRTAVTLYDLIPLVWRDLYLRDANVARDYEGKLEHLKRADLWFAISESTRREGIDLLGLPGDHVVNIAAAADEIFHPADVPFAWETKLRIHYGLRREFVMYTGGIDPRKNIEGLVRAWALLPQDVRRAHQLAIVCSANPEERKRLEDAAQAAGLARDELVLTGFVPDADLVDLYRLAKLFVFPSWHEGFGLPALEAMSCGTAVIGSDNSSIPEVIGRADALFDARSDESIAAKIAQCLADDALRRDLARTGPERARAFNWDVSAKRALAAIEHLRPMPRTTALAVKRPRLAFVSPLPPARCGIADYSAQLLPSLAKHYDIDAIVEQPELDPSVLASVSNVRNAQWLFEHGHEYDRIVYQFGNSHFHTHMVPLLRRHPGTVVLHDFFLSGLHAYRETYERGPYFQRALYESHGWRALARLMHASNYVPVMDEFPVSFDVVRDAQGVIVHSRYSQKLADRWYGSGTGDRFQRIPLLRAAVEPHREQARTALGLHSNDFLVCAFGMLGKTKLNDRLLRAWQLSSLATNPHCKLVFVGENTTEEYGQQVERQLAFAGDARITGWVSDAEFRRWLDAADLAVQLRTNSRGETSAAVLDVMLHGVPLVVNANGSMADLPPEAACILPDEFEDAELVRALEELHADTAKRLTMGEAGRRIVRSEHDPADCAQAYAWAIERFAEAARLSAAGLADALARDFESPPREPMASAVANAIAQDLPPPAPARQFFFDVTRIALADPHADLPPVLHALVDAPFPGWRAEPVYRAHDGRWRFAREFMLRRIGAPAGLLADDIVNWRREDAWHVPAGSDTGLPREVFEAGLETVPLAADAHGELLWPWIAGTTRRWHEHVCFVDISELMRRDWKSGVQRVVRNYLRDLLRVAPAGQIVVPVYVPERRHGYHVASRFLCEAAGLPLPAETHVDARIAPRAGDTFYAIDLQPHVIAEHGEDLREMREKGVKIVFQVYDLLPITLADCFVPEAAEHHERWLRVVADSDLAICNSQATADELRDWFVRQGFDAMPEIVAVHQGADIGSRVATHGIPDSAKDQLARMRKHPSFLMVGTLEPRKAHATVLDAFDWLWSQGSDFMLVIVGRPGWLCEPLVERLEAHPENGKRLLWFNDASDELLEEAYRSATALIQASRGEGFGLPLVEAAQRGVPVIARDLPVFRELAGEHAFYFADASPQGLGSAVREWLERKAQGTHPKIEGMRWMTWEESAARVRQLLEQLHQS